MYGMVHSGARSMVLAKFGEETWVRVLARCGLGDEHFLSGQNYPDETTISIISAISDETNTDLGDVLRTLGQHWIKFASQSHYGPMFRIAGNDLETFLQNLNRMHHSIRTTLPDSRMPRFDVLRSENGEVDLQYVSEREGLMPFVEGLLIGLMDHFGEPGSVSYRPGDGAYVFTLSRRAASNAA